MKFVILPTAPALVPVDFSIFRKTQQERVMLKKAKRVYRDGMIAVYGKDWKTSGYLNVPTKMLDENKYKG